MYDLGRVNTQRIQSPGIVSRCTHNDAISSDHQAQPLSLCHHVLQAVTGHQIIQQQPKTQMSIDNLSHVELKPIQCLAPQVRQLY